MQRPIITQGSYHLIPNKALVNMGLLNKQQISFLAGSILTIATVIVVDHQSLQADEGVLIKGISAGGRSFVVNLGAQDGIAYGQQSLFTSMDYSMSARAIKVARYYSLWKPMNPYIIIPFTQEEFIHFSPSPDGVWNEIPNLRLEIAKRDQEVANRKKWRDHRSENSLIVKFALSGSMSEVANQETSNEQDRSRSGKNFSFVYQQYFAKNTNVAIGGRYDNEILNIPNQERTIPSSRVLLVGEMSYDLNSVLAQRSFYLSAGGGVGVSQTNYENAAVLGNALLFPALSVNMVLKMDRNTKFLLYLGLENILTSEQFNDGTSVSTQILSYAMGVGMIF